MPLFIEETNPSITKDEDSFSGITYPGSNANYVGQTMGPGGMGISAYMDRPETQPGWTGYDYSPGYDTNTYNLGQTYGPVGMGMPAYMDRPGPMEMAAPPDNIGYDRIGPDLQPGLFQRRYMPNPKDKGLPAIYPAGLFDDPTADGGFIDRLSRWWYGDNDPENDYLDLPPDDGIEPYDPENRNHFMIPPDMDIEDMDIEDIIKQMQGEKFETNLESNDLYHLMRNGYTLEEAQEILNEQIGDGSFEMAELSGPQINFMEGQFGLPDIYSSYQDYKDAVDAREEKPLFGIFGGQEPATDSEIINKLKETYGTLPFQVPAIV